MGTDWQLIRDTLSATIDACEKLELLAVTDAEKGDPRARVGDNEEGVAVGDFFDRFWTYPEGVQRDIIRLRSKLGSGDQKHHTAFSRALVNTALACAEIIDVRSEELHREVEGFESHCGSAGRSMKSQLTGIGSIYASWMVPSITKAVTDYREHPPK
ncbi:MAG: hypothetical protein CMJ49_02765 [Planctomycetaceae bacterium]|nr:hypothetical protein [Planctomycetaceae bacterium]